VTLRRAVAQLWPVGATLHGVNRFPLSGGCGLFGDAAGRVEEGGPL